VVTQETVRHWFDGVYATRGLAYLRPVEAYSVFVHLLGARAGESLLDVACGPGLLLSAAAESGLRGFGIDLSTVAVKMLSSVAPEARALVGNAEELPYADASFDHVTCIGSLERMLSRERVLLEMGRVAKPGASFCVMVRNSRTLTWTIHAQLLGRRNVRGHQDAAGLEQWSDLFDRCGLSVEGIHPDQWLAQRLRRSLRMEWEPRPERPVLRTLAPLRFANEFIFVLRKASSGAATQPPTPVSSAR
jgi:SAM-dependent methyltransferase